MIVPIFIYRDRPSKEEMREEAERERRWRRLMEAEEANRERRKREEERREFMRRVEEREKAEKEYYEAKMKNPWDYQFLPEGWSILGQTYIPAINDHGYVYDGNEDLGGYDDWDFRVANGNHII